MFAARTVRRDGGRELPVGPKARRTRASILAAASTLFAENGYQRTTMADVAEAAGVSLGTVYQYFHDRADLVAGLVRASWGETSQRGDSAWHASEGRAGVYRVLNGFIESYAEQAAMARVWEEVVFVDDDLAELRRVLGRVFTESVERELQRATATGEVRAGLDPALTARALTGMVDRYCFVTYVFDPPDAGVPTPAESAELLTDLWVAAIGLTPSDSRGDRGR